MGPPLFHCGLRGADIRVLLEVFRFCLQMKLVLSCKERLAIFQAAVYLQSQGGFNWWFKKKKKRFEVLKAPLCIQFLLFRGRGPLDQLLPLTPLLTACQLILCHWLPCPRPARRGRSSDPWTCNPDRA